MNSRKTIKPLKQIAGCVLAPALLTTAVQLQAGAFDPDNVTPNQLISGVYSITIKQTGTIPTVRVKSDGNSYTDVQPGQSIAWQGNSRGVCRSLRNIIRFKWWIHDSKTYHPSAYFNKHDKLTEKVWISKRHNDDKYEVAGTLSTPVTSRIAQDAVKACNNYLDNQLGQGKTKQQVFSSDHTIPAEQHQDTRIAAVTYMACWGQTKEAHAWQNIKINYMCEGSDVPAPKHPGIGKFDAPFMLDTPLVGINPSNYTGTCPVDLKVEGTLKGNKGQQPVKYRWSHNGALGPVYNATLNTNGWRSVQMTLKDIGKPKQAGPANQGFQAQQPQANPQQLNLNANPSNVHTGYVELKALPANSNDWSKAKTSSKAAYRVTCQEPKKGTLVMPKPDPSPRPTPRPTPRPRPAVDLLPGPTLTIGNQTGNWGGMLNVDASQFGATKQNGRCQLRMMYDVKNQGNAGAGAFKSRLFENNQTLHQASIASLAAGGSKKVSGNIYLNNGTHHVQVFVDNQTQIAESNENNNKNRITVKVRNCNGAIPARPSPRPAIPATPASPRPAIPATPASPRPAIPATPASPRPAIPATPASPRPAIPATPATPRPSTPGTSRSSVSPVPLMPQALT